MNEDGEDIDEEQQSVAAHHGYSIYEPHYQQMHPLIFYEDAAAAAQHNQSHHHMHFGQPVVSQHHWDQDHFVHMPMMTYGDSSAARCIQTGSLESFLGNHEAPELAIDGVDQSRNPDQQSKENQENGSPIVEVEVSRGQKSEYREDTSECKADQSTVSAVVDSEPQVELVLAAPTKTKHRRRHRRAPPIKQATNSLSQVNNGSEASGKCQPGKGPESPQPSNRELHNEIERRRRMRIKQCCDVLRTLVPGLDDKTDKATVLELTVKYVTHLSNCANVCCTCVDIC